MRLGSLLRNATVLGAVLISVSAQASGVNGSFEQPGGSTQQITGSNFLPGWTYDDNGGTAVDFYEKSGAAGFNAEHGNYYVSFGHTNSFGGSITQDIDTVAGGTYIIHYWLTQQTSTDPNQLAAASVYNGGDLLNQNITSLTMPDGTWVMETLTFLAVSDTSTLVIQDVTPGSARADWALDNVRISATPLPAALPMFGSALCAAGVFAWRRRKRAA